MAVSSLKILVAEDEPTSRKVVRRLLENMGCEVRCATDGEQALEMFGSEHFDCVIMDLFMPRMDGDEVINIIRNSPEFREKSDVPIFGLTAYDVQNDQARFENVRVEEWLSKPVDYEVLARVAARVENMSVS